MPKDLLPEHDVVTHTNFHFYQEHNTQEDKKQHIIVVNGLPLSASHGLLLYKSE